MPVPLPVLDDRRWSDLIDEGRALIPLYAPEWTDHNVHDPGITLMELFAWIAEMDVYRLNRIPDSHKEKFLQLIGLSPRPPAPSRSVIAIEINGTNKIELPAGTEFSGLDRAGVTTPFRALAPITLVQGHLQAVQREIHGVFEDLTAAAVQGQPLDPFGVDPQPGATLCLGFSQAFPAHATVCIQVETATPEADAAERQRIENELRGSFSDGEALRHHSARTTWEFLETVGGSARWSPLPADDRTRALTLSGAVAVRLPGPMAASAIGRVSAPSFYVRCRFTEGAYDAAPSVTRIELNGVDVEQVTPAWASWPIAPGAAVPGTAPARGQKISFDFALDVAGRLASLKVPSVDPAAPQFMVLDYEVPSPKREGRLVIEAVRLGAGSGAPGQVVGLPAFPIEVATLALFTVEDDQWHPWSSTPDFVASRANDQHAVVDASAGTVIFGDGQQGRVPPAGAVIVSSAGITRAEAGNLAALAIDTLADSTHNRALLDVAAVRLQLLTIGNAQAANSGAAQETLSHCIGRAVELREARLRAVTAEDYEALSRETPGVKIARVTGRPAFHPGFPCVRASGRVTVIVVPSLPAVRPYPSSGLRQAVAAYLARRRVIGTRVDVVGPEYVPLKVRARIRVLPGSSNTQVRDGVSRAIDELLHPLRGGPDGTGWPFGRDVYRSEVMQAIDEVPGVDHVLALAFIVRDGDPVCGNVCVGPMALVAAARHEIETV